jgi:diaminohydroxyphosphoribosylaminopyrimidine deaminase/5-amino-6-(5-phosphoribosylamino)uracil reductase
MDECREMIRPFSKWITTGLPYVIAKVGQSLDGRITRPAGEGPWITSESARAHGRRLRARVDAILVGAGTIRADNPQLTIREGAPGLKEQPYRVILSNSSTLPESSHVFTDEHKERTWVLRDLSFIDALKELSQRGIVTVLIEGGAHVLGQAFAAQAVDEIVWYVAPRICGSAGLPSIGGPPLDQSVQIDHVNILPLGDNVCITGHPVWPKHAPSKT